jgi:hypothetical protein
MRRLLTVITGACLLALVVALPASATPPTGSPDNFGQIVKSKAHQGTGGTWGGWVSEHATQYAGEVIPQLAHTIKANDPIYIPTNPPVIIAPGDPLYPDNIGDAVATVKPLLQYVTPD